METPKIAKQVIGFQKTMFDNTYNAITVMQDNTENMMTGFLKQFPWVTEEVTKPLNDSITFTKKARDDYKKIVDQGFDKFTELVNDKQDRTAGKGQLSIENQTIFSQTIDFYKTAFANTLAIILTMQQQGEDLLKTALEQNPWLPESNRNACLYWTDACTKNLQSVITLIDQGIPETEQLSATKPETNKPEQTIATDQNN